MRLVASARSAGLCLTVADIFSSPLLIDMAKVASRLQENQMTLIKPFALLTDSEVVPVLLDEAAKQCTTSRSSIQDVYPATALQEGLMALSMKEPGAYVAHHEYSLPVSIDIERFKSAWGTLTKLSPIMRTRIIQAKSGCFQVVIDEPVSWIYLEESMTSPNTVYGQPMSPGSPLTRNILLSKSNGGYKFVWQAHHSVYDGWSLSLIHDRLQKLYRGLGIGHVTEYNQFIKHIESIKGSKGFWKAELQDAIPSHFPKTSTYRTRSSNSLRYKIDFSRRTDSPITTSTLIRAAWAVIVARYSNTSLHGADVCFGATLNGRNAPVPGIQEMLGTTITTVPIRVQFGHGEDVPAFLQRMQDQSVRMINHEHMGLQNIKSACPEAAAVLDFQNLLMVQPSQGQTEGSIFGWQAEPGSFDKHFHTYPLTMESFLTQSGATMLATFDSHIVTEKQMQRIMFQFDHGIQQLCMETPGALVTSLEVISQADKEEIQTWNKAPPTPVNCCVHILIEEEARKNPNAPAICSWDGDLSYHELDALASKLALEMVESGVGPETVVPLLFSKSLWTKVAMFAVMKAGGAFLMLDPLHPQSRLKSILHKVKPPILVSSPQHLKLARTLSHEVIVVSQDRLDQPTESVGSLPEKLSSSGTVYLIFTSGSSGEPKGICVSHQSLSTSTLAHGKAMKFTSRTRALQFTAYTFDVSLCEIITTLVHGGCICIPHENFRTSDVSREVRRMAVNWAFFTPSFVRLLDPASMPSLETLVLGGEKPSADNVKAWAKRLTLINGYGPSEASVFSVTNEMEDGTPPNNIGLAVGCSSWITEPGNTNQLAPIGAPGELCLAGPIVAKGYFNDPQRTATSFSEHSPQSSGSPIPYRSYMTGDIVQYDSFGKLLYLGRKDDQIKLRGYRIELGEIDHCLASSDRIKQGFALLPISGCCRENITAVLSLHDIPVAPGEAKFRLVSQEWVPIASGNISQIRERFFEILPSYMVPTVWIVVDNVPLLSSNKLDRVQGKQWVNQMTEEDFARVRRNVEESVSRMPTSMMEVRLQSVWSQILNRPLEETGVDNSFYSLGGDSISAMQVMVRARDEGIIFSVQDILQCRTISKLAPRARTNVLSSEKDEEEIFDIPFRLSPIQRTFFALSPHGENHFHQSFRLRFTQPFPDVRIASAIEAVIARHSMLRARFRENEGRWIQTMGRSVRGSYHFRSHEVADMKETRSIAAKTQTLIDIQGGLLFAVDLLRIKGSREQLLFMAAHHLVIDLVSWRIIIQDVEDYLRLGEFTSHVPVSFRKRCLLQQDGDLYSSEIFPDQSPDDHPAYWGITHDQNTYGNLTTDRFSIDEDTTNLLFGTCNAAFHTEPIDVLLATVLHSFGESFRDRALPPIFNESHGRQDSKTATDWSGTVGWFTTFQRVALENYSNNVEAVRSVKDFRRSAARHEAASSGHPNIVPHMEILLNYIGLFQGLNRDGALFLQVQDEELQDLPDISPGMRRFALFELSASLGGGKLEMSFAYPAGIRHQQQIKAWVSLCESGIKNVVNILSKLPVSVTLADFPLLSLDYPGLGKLVDITLPQAGIKDVHAVQDAFPCSPIQQGILISQTKHLDPYNIRFILNPVTDRDCDVHLLSNAWQKLMSWHECLRSIFVENLSGDGRFGQVVLREHHSNVLCMECEDESGAREALLNVPWSDYSGNSIPHKLTIAQHRAGITCMLDISHAVLDGTSIQLLLRDWARACCNEFGLGPQPAYSGYISHVLSQPLSSALEFWKEYLANMEPCHFPTNAVKCPIRTRIVELELPKWAGFRDFREKHEITSFAMFRAAWALVLRSYTSSDSVCFGFLTSGRELPVEKINEIIGPLANLLICRMDLKPADSLLDVLESMQNDYESVIPHQLCSLTDINDALGLPGDALFNTTISLQRPDHTSLESDVGIHFETIHAEVSGEYDIMLEIEESESSFSIRLNYAEPKISAFQASNITHNLQQIFHSLAAQPVQTVGRLSLFADRDWQHIRKWNEVPAESLTVNSLVHELFQAQARRRPTEMAVEAWDGRLTYAQLDDVSSRLAHRLVKTGVQPRSLVMLAFEKSIFSIIAQLAVMKSGAACLSIDPSHPRSRLEKIRKDADVTVIITSPLHANSLTAMAANMVVLSEGFLSRLPAESQSPCSNIQPEDIAFCLFTSGSTGVPKGILLSHAAICTTCRASGHAMCVSDESRVLQFASYTFDMSIYEVFTTFQHGGCVCVPTDWDRLNNLVEVSNRLAITWAYLTPSIARLLHPGDIPTLQQLVLGGEAVAQDDIDPWIGKVRILNGYGPAEATVCVVTEYTDQNRRAETIGKAVGCTAWITQVEDVNQLAVIGQLGELIIEGGLLAKEYLNDAVKTRRGFIPCPSALTTLDPSRRTQRFYRTGDICRYNEFGTVDFHGRRDEQIKIRGQRVELEEVESHLRSCAPANVSIATTMFTPKDMPTEKLLAAVVVFEDSGSMGVGAEERLTQLSEYMNERLSAVLPAYMIPTMYIPSPNLPQMSSGKLDRKKLAMIAASALQAQALTIKERGSIKQRPSTTMEVKMLELWTQVLGTRHDIGTKDKFFGIGGNSLAAMKLVAAARKAGLSLTVANVFEFQQLSAMAQILKPLKGSAPVAELPLFGLVKSVSDLELILAAAARQCRVPRDDILDAYPSTPIQEGLMFSSLRAPEAYVTHLVLPLNPTVDIPAFRKAWDTIILTNAILRTRLISTNVGVYQVVLRERNGWNQEIDGPTGTLDVQFGAPLLRYRIHDTDPPRFDMLMHHSIFDGLSMELIFRDLTKLYRGCPEKRPDFKYLIRHLAEDTTLGKARSFWMASLVNALPSVFPRFPSVDYLPVADSHETLEISIPQKRHPNVTASSALWAAWALIVARYSTASEATIGVALSGRNAPVEGIERMTGPCLTTVPFRVKLDREGTVSAYLQSVQDAYSSMIPYEHTGIKGIRKLGPDAETACGFRSLIVVQPEEETAAPGFKPIYESTGRYHTFALTLECALTCANGVVLTASYDSNVIDGAQMQRILRQFGHVVSQLGEDPDKSIADVELITDLDRKELWSINEMKKPETVDACVHNLVEAKTLYQPDAPAIQTSNDTLTYAQLDTIASRLAHQLQGQGIRPRVLVPLVFEKSLWYTVAMFAVLKAGGCCVPLDPAHPMDRILATIEDAGAKFVLTSRAQTERFKNITPRTITIDDSLVESSFEDDSALAVVESNNPAFVLFTSGSSGKPKGIVISHRAYCSSAKSHASALRIDAQSRVLQFAAHSYDVSYGEIFTTLIQGGCICVPSEEQRMNAVAEFINSTACNWAFFTPTVASLLSPTQVPGLRTVVLGGEPATRLNYQIWASSVDLINSYGPAECSIWSHRRAGVARDDDPSNVGHQLANLAWITEPDDPQSLSPFGCVGQLLIEGPTLADGYLNNPETTAAAFLEDPDWLRHYPASSGPRRFYQTGDLARMNSDGTICILGRKDTAQIKIRGQRVEVGEIEFHLKKNIDREVAVTIITPEDERDPLLAAYVSLEKQYTLVGTEGTLAESTKTLLANLTEDLATRLSHVLPKHMIPTIYLPIKTMPLMTSGKTDRRRLQELGSSLSKKQILELGSPAKRVIRPPVTEMEQKLRVLWAEVLRLDAEGIGLDDSFMRLGGDSFTSMRLSVAARGADISLHVSEILRNHRLVDMAQKVVSLDPAEDHSTEVEPFSLLHNSNVSGILDDISKRHNIAVEDIHDCLPPTPLQEGLMALSLRVPGAYIAQHAWRVPSGVDIEVLRNAVETMVERSPILRTRIVETAKQGLLQVVSKEPLTWLESEDLDTYLAKDRQCVMNIGDPLSRFGIVREAGRRFLIMTAHHSIYDGHSISLVLRTLEEVYHGLPTQTANFNRFIKHLMEKETPAAERFWGEYLKDTSPTQFPVIPTSGFVPHTSSFMKSHIRVASSAISSITIPTLLRAAWAMTVANYSDTLDVVYGETFSGRNAPVAGIESVVGPTITTVPVRIRLTQSQLIVDFLHDVQQSLASMVDFEQFGLQNINKLGVACDFQNLLVIQPLDRSQTNGVPLGFEPVSLDVPNFHTFALTVECSIKEDGVEVMAGFDERVFENEQIRRILARFDHFAQQLTNTRKLTLEDIETIPDTEMRAIYALNTEPSPTVDVCIHQLIGQNSPRDPAVVAWDGNLSYGELEEFATRLAAYLQRQHGVGPEVKVLLCMEKSMYAIVCILAILKAGGAFVPLDASHPKERLMALARQTQSTVALTSHQTSSTCRDLVSDGVVVDGGFLGELADDPSEITTLVQPGNAAYVMFTSGTTNIPKGVVVEHGAYSTGAIRHTKAIKLHRGCRVFQFSSYSFDTSIEDILSTLIVGGCICIPSEEERSNNLAGAINRFEANWTTLTPSVATLLDPDKVPSLKVLCLAGETMTESHVQTWADRLDLYNVYGPTECCVTSTASAKMTSESNASNIGYPIQGSPMARGYLDNPTETAKSFVDNLAWRKQPSRMYCTGDLVKMNSDGGLVFVGRKDSQVKLRGQRIEVREIERHIKSSVRDTEVVVDVIERDNCDRALAAFVVVGPESGRSEEETMEQFRLLTSDVEGRLAHALPSFMIPTIFVPVKQIPLTLSGKIDRRKLGKIGSEATKSQMAELRMATSTHGNPPTTQMQILLSDLWSTLLKIDRKVLTTASNFIHLGGDSITAMRLAASCYDAGDPWHLLRLSEQRRWKHLKATAHQASNLLSRLTTEKLRVQVGATSFPLDEDLVEDMYDATDFQGWAFECNLLEIRGWLTYFVFEFQGSIDHRRLRDSCRRLVQHHPILRTACLSLDQQVRQVVLRAGRPDFDALWTEINDDHSPKHFCYMDMTAPLTTCHLPTQFTLVKGTSAHSSLIIRLSHSQYDGISTLILFNDLRSLYTHDKISHPRALSFSTFLSASQKASSTGSLEHWRTLLLNSQRTSILSHPSPSYRNPLNCTVSKVLQHTTQVHNITFSNTLKAAWAFLLSHLSSSTDILFGHLVSGRNLPLPNIFHTSGPCLTLIPVRIKLSPSLLVRDLLHLVQNQHIASIPHENVGFRRIVRECTAWPCYTRFSSVVQYQNYGGYGGAELQVGEVRCTKSVYGNEHDSADVWVVGWPQEGGGVRIELLVCEAVVGKGVAQRLLDLLCLTIETFAENADTPLSSLNITTASQLQDLHLPLNAHASPPSSGLSADLAIHPLVREAWERVMGDRDIAPDKAFYDISGTLFAAAQFAEFYTGRGVGVGMEEMIENPSMGMQTVLVGGRLRVREE